jgi:DNA-binding transcriptional regulator YiaG
MDEGVDPTAMCRSLVEKISQSEQLRSVTDPEILILFEDWLEELENEAVKAVRRGESLSPEALSRQLGLSESGSMFLITKLKRDGKI